MKSDKEEREREREKKVALLFADSLFNWLQPPELGQIGDWNQ